MQHFLVLVGQLFLIACIQAVLEIFMSDRNHMQMSRLITIACYLGSLYIVIQFTSNYLFKELSSFMTRLF